MNTILGLDPGGTTGWSLWQYDALTPPRPIEHGQVSGGLDGFLEWWEGDDMGYRSMEVVSESFRLDGRTPKPDVTPLRIEGALRVLRPDVIYQPNTMKMHLTDDRIKALGLWWKGEPHAIDSMRHVWALMRARRHMPTLLCGWPPARKPVG